MKWNEGGYSTAAGFLWKISLMTERWCPSEVTAEDAYECDEQKVG